MSVYVSHDVLRFNMAEPTTVRNPVTKKKNPNKGGAGLAGGGDERGRTRRGELDGCIMHWVHTSINNYR